MKILVVTIEPPLPFSSAAAKWYYVLIHELQQRGHDVTCLSACSKPSDITAAQEIFLDRKKFKFFPFPNDKRLRKKIRSVFRPFSYMFSTDFLKNLQIELENDYDIIHVEQLWAGWVIPPHCIKKTLINIHHLVMIDLEMRDRDSLRSRYEYFQTKRAETLLMKKFRYHRFFTSRLKEKASTFLEINENNLKVVPFSLNSELYPIKQDILSTLKIGMIASMGWYPGHSAAFRLINSIFPKVSSQMEEVILAIAGWGAKKELADFIGKKNIEISENLPLVQDFFHSLTVFVYLPSRGSGMKIKVLEAMLYGIPVVTTSEGVEGLPAKNKIHAFIVENDEEAIQATIELLKDIKLREKIRNNARQLVEEYCDKKKVVDELETIYKTINGG